MSGFGVWVWWVRGTAVSFGASESVGYLLGSILNVRHWSLEKGLGHEYVFVLMLQIYSHECRYYYHAVVCYH